VARLNVALLRAPRTPVTEHHYQLAKDLLPKHGEDGRRTLQHIRKLGELRIAGWHTVNYPEGISERKRIADVLQALGNDGLLRKRLDNPHTGSEEEVWQIPESFANALDDLLYPESISESAQM
jgi:hypothetical protein